MPAWNRIDIPKEELENLYLNQKLSIAQISNLFNCTTGPIHESLRKFKIPIRTLSEACTKVSVTKKQLKDWYFKEKLSMFEIADKLGCTHSAIVYKFQRLGIKSRGHLGLTRPIKLTKKGFEHLYYERGLSLRKIAKIVHCSESRLERRFKQYGLKSRGIKNRACKYKKFDFSGDPIEKAYLIGFRLGDLNVYDLTNIVQVRCSTTRSAQVRLIRKMFSPYTTPHIWKAKRGTTEIICLLNKSFSFLVTKKDEIPKWIMNNNKLFWSFFAGYADAEGCIAISKENSLQIKEKVSFQMSTYDFGILTAIKDRINKYGIGSYFFLKRPKGTRITGTNYFSNGDAWCLSVHAKQSLWILIQLWKKYSKHIDKIKRLMYAEDNLERKNLIKWSKPIDLSLPAI